MNKNTLIESLFQNNFIESYLSKSSNEIEKLLGKEVAKMVYFTQKNSHHCYDLFEHTLRAVASIPIDSFTEEQQILLKVAGFFHDIGKTEVSSFNPKTGQQVFYGHAKKSSEIAYPILKKLGFEEKEIKRMCFLIAHHDDFISYKTELEPYMYHHLFIRKISKETIAEKIIENQIDFVKIGYSEEQIRVICYTLIHNRKPFFKVKDPTVLEVNMKQVLKEIQNSKNHPSYIPTLEDYQMLLALCKGDASAQSEVAIQNGKVVGSKKEKLKNFHNIELELSESMKLANEVLRKSEC